MQLWSLSTHPKNVLRLQPLLKELEVKHCWSINPGGEKFLHWPCSDLNPSILSYKRGLLTMEKKAINMYLATDCTVTQGYRLPKPHQRNWNADPMPNSKTAWFKVSQCTDWEDLFVDRGRIVSPHQQSKGGGPQPAGQSSWNCGSVNETRSGKEVLPFSV